MEYTLDMAIKSAINHAKEKIKEKKFISLSDNEFDFDNQDNFENGDPENIETLASLYAQGVKYCHYDIARDAIVEELEKEFPEYV